MLLLVGSLVANAGLLEEVIGSCLNDYFLKEIKNKPFSEINKFKRLVAKLPVASQKVAVALVQSNPP